MRFLSTKPSWSDLRARLLDELPRTFPATAFDVSADDDEPLVAWHEGPAEGTVARTTGDVPGWRYESTMIGPDPDASSGLRVLRLSRTLSDRALALAVVRFHASDVRPFARSRPGAVEKLWAILEEDDPASCGYPLTERICDELMAAPDPAGAGVPPDDPAERWAWKLATIGYDRLWSTAWAAVEL